MANSVTLFASILKSSLIIGNYLQQTTSADDIFRRIFSLRFLETELVSRLSLSIQ